MKKTFYLLPVFLSGTLFSQTIFPTPHQVNTTGSVAYHGVKSKNPILQNYISKNGISIKEKQDKTLAPEAYQLSVKSNKITIKFSTERGKYYAYKSLNQIFEEASKNNKLPITEINDFPDLPQRGSVEGFYGEPWSLQDRISQFKLYGDWKLNTYIYGPKDDPYHSSPKWREAYPEAEAAKLKTLVDAAKENHVDFYWAIHPGLDIKWTDEDRNAIVQKFEKMYAMGVRGFAVFFDDISGEGTKAEKQAGLMNFLQTEFVDKKKDVGPLIICPTDYNKSWANPKEDGYLGTLGKQLDKRIQIMWTGDHVLADITTHGQQFVNKLIKRPAFVWWNFPVSDYTRNHLLLGPVYGLDNNAKAEMSGFVSNPMDKSEASKVALFSVADYTWNIKDYNPTLSWNAAIERIHPEVSDAYKVFSEHNADPGPNFSDYRREESTSIASILDQQIKGLEKGKILQLSSADFTKLKSELSKFETSATKIATDSKNEKLKQEIKPWLDYFAVEGKAGLLLLEMNKETNLDQLFSIFQKFDAEHQKMSDINMKENRNPYQPGIVTASKHVLPWIEQSYLYYHQLLKSKGYAVKDVTNQATGKVYTNITTLKSLPIQNIVVMGNRAFPALKLNAVNEYVTFKPQDYLGVEVTSKSAFRELKFKATEKVVGLENQYSADGVTWSKEKVKGTRFVRVINTSSENKQVKPQVFEVVFE